VAHDSRGIHACGHDDRMLRTIELLGQGIADMNPDNVR
jgi:hypothetical protein